MYIYHLDSSEGGGQKRKAEENGEGSENEDESSTKRIKTEDDPDSKCHYSLISHLFIVRSGYVWQNVLTKILKLVGNVKMKTSKTFP